MWAGFNLHQICEYLLNKLTHGVSNFKISKEYACDIIYFNYHSGVLLKQAVFLFNYKFERSGPKSLVII